MMIPALRRRVEPTNLSAWAAVVAFLAATPFSLLWFGLFALAEVGFGDTQPNMAEQLLKLLVYGLGMHELIVLAPAWLVSAFTNTERKQIWLVAHVPGVLIVGVWALGSFTGVG